MPIGIRYLIVAIYISFVGLTTSLVLEKPELPATGCFEIVVTGYSHLNLPIELCHVGGSHPGSKHSMLVIGSIHGSEPAGKYVVDELVKIGARQNTDLWVIRNGNPDGATRGIRQNEIGVDLNRNFPTGWYPSDPENNFYSGTNPASEPETQALMKAIDLVKPAVLITIHQPYAVVDCSRGKDENLDERLAALTGLPAGCIPGEKSGSPTNTYTGTITGWANQRYEHTSALALELGPVVSQAEILKYAAALHNLEIQ